MSTPILCSCWFCAESSEVKTFGKYKVSGVTMGVAVSPFPEIKILILFILSFFTLSLKMQISQISFELSIGNTVPIKVFLQNTQV